MHANASHQNALTQAGNSAEHDPQTLDQAGLSEHTRLEDDSIAKAQKELERILQVHILSFYPSKSLLINMCFVVWSMKSKGILKDELKAWVKSNKVAFASAAKQPTKQGTHIS